MNKPNDALTIGEVAASFGWSPRFVEALIRAEKIPGLEINGVHYFRRNDIIDWLDQKIHTLDAARLGELEKKLESDSGGVTKSVPIDLDIREYLSPSAIELDAPLSSKRTILERLVDLAASSGRVLDRSHLLASLIEREAILSTGLPGGVAICNPRRPVSSSLTNTTLAFLRTSEPVSFGSDYGPTQLFFLLAATDERIHLHGLARLTRVLRSDTLKKLSDPDFDNVVEIIDLLAG